MTSLNGYLLTELSGQTYLLPYGQNIAAFRRGLKMNETGTLICRALQDGKTEEELPALLASYYEADEQELPLLREDIDRFYEQLRILGVLDRPSPCLCFPTETFQKFLIGTVILQINLEDELIPKEFWPFAVRTQGAAIDSLTTSGTTEGNDTPGQATALPPADLTVSVRFGQPTQRPVGKVLIHSAELLILEAEDCYSLTFLSSPDLITCHMDKEARFACFYCRSRDSETLREELFHGIRFAWLLTAEQQGLYAIHSASILYRGNAWLFSASSGTGKSTHANLWQALYGTPMRNGDLNLLGIKDGEPVVYGLPWCGTSGISTTETSPLGGVIFLQQSAHNCTESLSADERSLMLCQRLISPTWTKDMLSAALSFCEQIEPNITCFRLCCTPDREAAEVCRAAIDAALDRTSIR